MKKNKWFRILSFIFCFTFLLFAGCDASEDALEEVELALDGLEEVLLVELVLEVDREGGLDLVHVDGLLHLARVYAATPATLKRLQHILRSTPHLNSCRHRHIIDYSDTQLVGTLATE